MCSVKYSLKELDNTYFIKESIVWRIRKMHFVYVVKYSVKNMQFGGKKKNAYCIRIKYSLSELDKA